MAKDHFGIAKKRVGKIFSLKGMEIKSSNKVLSMNVKLKIL